VVIEESWRLFRAGIAPLREAGRLGSVLFQFPPWFGPGAGSRTVLEECRERVGVPVGVEFRHPGWYAPDQLPRTLEFLSSHNLPLVGVDTAQGLSASLPPVAEATSGHLAVVRFHGRSPQWGTGDKEGSYRHHYTEAELRPWVPRIEALAAQAREVHVLFNNCCAAASVDAAGMMHRLLGPALSRGSLSPAAPSGR
jgi:uncharacterized protein YecE (DUF72 family)